MNHKVQSLSTWMPLESLLNILQKRSLSGQCLLTVFEILLFVSRSVLSPTQRGKGKDRAKVSAKNQKNIWTLLKLLEKWLIYKLRRFWMVFNFFFLRFSLTVSVQEKLKNSTSEMPKIPQTLNINNLRTTIAKSINQHTNRNLIEYFLKNVLVKSVFTVTIFSRYCCSKVGRYYHSERKG